MMLARALRANAPRRAAGQQLRRMSAAAAEAAEPAKKPFPLFNFQDPVVLSFWAVLSGTYLMCARWVREDTKLAKKVAAHKAAMAPSEPAAEEAAAAAPSAVTAAVVTPAAAPAALPASGAASPMDWKVADVQSWLTAIELPQHADAFKTHAIDGPMLLVLTEQDLYSVCNVVSPLHRKKIMMAINNLRADYLGA